MEQTIAWAFTCCWFKANSPKTKGRSPHVAGVVAQPPSGTELDDSAFEAGALYENNARLEDVLRGLPDWNLTDVHSGVYMLGTRLAESNSWF